MDNFEQSMENQVVVAVVETVEDIDNIRQRAKALTKQISNTYWELAELCAKVLQQKLYKTWGFDRYEEYLENELEMQKTRGFSLSKVFNYFTQQIPKIIHNKEIQQAAIDVAKEIGWSKAYKIAQYGILDEANAMQVLDQAKRLTADQFDLAIKTSIPLLHKKNYEDDDFEKIKKGKLTENSLKTIKKAFFLTLNQADTLNEKIKEIRLNSDVNLTEEEALVSLCKMSGISESDCLGEVLSSIEENFKCSLVAFDSDYTETLYGAGTLDEYLEEHSAESETEDDAPV